MNNFICPNPNMNSNCLKQTSTVYGGLCFSCHVRGELGNKPLTAGTIDGLSGPEGTQAYNASKDQKSRFWYDDPH